MSGDITRPTPFGLIEIAEGIFLFSSFSFLADDNLFVDVPLVLFFFVDFPSRNGSSSVGC